MSMPTDQFGQVPPATQNLKENLSKNQVSSLKVSNLYNL